MLDLTCPLCSKQAKISSTYPSIVVCSCTGKLLEVGEIINKQFIKSVKTLNTTSHNLSLHNHTFTIKELKSQDDMMAAGRELNNALSSHHFLSSSVGSGKMFEQIFLLEVQGQSSLSFNKIMCAVTKRKAHNFVKARNALCSTDEIIVIQAKLRELGLID